MARLAAFDMDGTLLMPDHRLGEKTLSTLKRLRDRDITLTFATGRHALEMRVVGWGIPHGFCGSSHSHGVCPGGQRGAVNPDYQKTEAPLCFSQGERSL